MAVDFAHPVITDLYSAAPGSPDWPTYIQDNIAAVASWLDGADPAGKRVGFKRISGGEIQEWNGSAWVRRALNYFSNTGGAVTGAVTITATPRPLELRSGSAAAPAMMTIGRTAAEGFLGISGGANQITTGDVAGDITLRNDTGRIFLSLGVSGYLSISAAAGIISGAGFSSIGALTPPSGAALQIGTSSGFPIARWTYPSAPADQRIWDAYTNESALIFRAVNDAQSLATEWVRVLRNTHQITTTTFAGRIGIGAVPPAGVGLEVTTGYIRVLSDGGVRFVNSALTHGGNVQADASGTRLTSDGGNARIATGGVDRLTVGANALVGINRIATVKQFEVSGGIAAGYTDGEAYRVVGNGAYISWYSADLTTRRGYIQHNVPDFVWSNEANGGFYFLGGGSNRFVVLPTGRGYLGDAVDANRIVVASELSGNANALVVAGIKLVYGKINTTLGATATVSFPVAFGSAVFAFLATAATTFGVGWVLRYGSQTLTGFTYGFDNYNASGGGTAATISYLAIGV